MSLASRIAYNTVVSIGGRAMGVALSLVSFGLIARYLGQEDFGSYALILAFLGRIFWRVIKRIFREGLFESVYIGNTGDAD